ncbi:hypothetical protein [Tuwongella immobilis]|uniref:Uncharacterized protein n=1 Tax=Tuwongella immobilis TaxID=692036 RepID=A0A6C2YKV4_9BACT|nr:hypothetical protein [Tuwongella immobilis]VIP02210.1 unnamed protein product [Tuwongella immobilis]VTS00717.1 unnamed protein product [Tuwongella immobilis]
MFWNAFFSLAMLAPNRQYSLRAFTVAHICAVAGLFLLLSPTESGRITLGLSLLILGIFEGGALIGWRLTQMPKSQAMEFLLVSPLQPKRLFLAEAMVGLARFTLISLTGVPVILILASNVAVEWGELPPLIIMPWTWGMLTGLILTTWAYEPLLVRRIGEIIMAIGTLIYLVVGVLAAERLIFWLQELPAPFGEWLYLSIVFAKDYNPFGVMQNWFSDDRVVAISIERMIQVQLFAMGMIALLLTRCAWRLKGHFHDRHYKPINSGRVNESDAIGDAPLSWWAVRRVMEYSGRVNLYLAGGFTLLYSLYLVAGDRWPAWLGTNTFTVIEMFGGAPMLATALLILASVPGAFQYGLWDSSVQDRCRRLELLLLTELQPLDYWHAARKAALKRGLGYGFVAGVLIAAMVFGGHISPLQGIGCAAAAVIMWCFSFVIGFRSFGNGSQANGLGSVLTLGCPILIAGFMQAELPLLAGLVPHGGIYLALVHPADFTWAIGTLIVGGLTLWLARSSIRRCDSDLRSWYDQNQGQQTIS